MKNDMQEAQRIETMMVVINIAMRILSSRVITVISLLLNAAVVSWAMYSESWVRLAGAAIFCVASWCTVNLKGKPNEA